MVPKQKNLTNSTAKKKRARRELNSRLRTLTDLIILFDHPVSNLICVQTDMDLFVRIETWGNRNSYFDQKPKTAPIPGRRREHGRGRPRQSRERRAKRGATSKQHTEWWTLPRARAFARIKTWSKSDLTIAETTWPTYIYEYLQGCSAPTGWRPPWLRVCQYLPRMYAMYCRFIEAVYVTDYCQGLH